MRHGASGDTHACSWPCQLSALCPGDPRSDLRRLQVRRSIVQSRPGEDRKTRSLSATGAGRSRGEQIENGRSGLASLLELGTVPTAIVCTTDALALGAMSEARRKGLHIPEDMSVVEFDDIDVAAETDPALTTVKNPAG